MPSGNTVTIEPTARSPTLDAPARLSRRRRALASSRCERACPWAAARGCAASGKSATMPKMPSPPPSRPPRTLRRLHDVAAALDDRRPRTRRGRPRALREHVTLFDERAPRHEVLAPRDEADAEEEQTRAEGRAEDPGLAFTQKAAPKRRHEQLPRTKRTAMTRSTVWGFFAAGWRCGSFSLQPLRATGVRCSRVAHERSPIQKPMRARRPTPSARPTKPSATGPSPPSPKPPGFSGAGSRS